MVPTLGNRIRHTNKYEAFLASLPGSGVDLTRARGNLQLHCKSGTFSIFLFNLF